MKKYSSYESMTERQKTLCGAIGTLSNFKVYYIDKGVNPNTLINDYINEVDDEMGASFTKARDVLNNISGLSGIINSVNQLVSQSTNNSQSVESITDLIAFIKDAGDAWASALAGHIQQSPQSQNVFMNAADTSQLLHLVEHERNTLQAENKSLKEENERLKAQLAQYANN